MTLHSIIATVVFGWFLFLSSENYITSTLDIFVKANLRWIVELRHSIAHDEVRAMTTL